MLYNLLFFPPFGQHTVFDVLKCGKPLNISCRRVRTCVLIQCDCTADYQENFEFVEVQFRCDDVLYLYARIPVIKS